MPPDQPDHPPRSSVWRIILPLIVALLTAGALNIALEDTDHDGRLDRVNVVITTDAAVPATVGVDGADRDREPDDVLEIPREARELNQAIQADPERFDFGPGLRGQDRGPVAVPPGPLATPNFPGCDTRILPANYSNRTPGSRVRAIAVHYTAGGNLPGLADMLGLTSYASSPQAGVSWHFLIDAEGHCFYSVPLERKSWAIGNLNSQVINIEVIQKGTEAFYPAGAAGQRKLSAVVRRLAGIYNLPIRVGATNGNCTVTVTGVITHWQGGPCSGGHHDIRPYDLGKVVAAIRADVVPPVPAKVRSWCAGVERFRRQVRAGDRPGAGARALATRRRELAGKYGYKCVTRGGRSAAVKR